MSRLTAVVVALSLASAPPAIAQTADPIDLARGLRENGLPDLALEFLQELSTKRPTPGALAVIPLERARAKLELAAEESDDGKRTALVGEAKADFDRFLGANATHPRRAEAALSLARLISVQAKGMVSKANKRADDKERVRELLAARPVFNDAARRFSQAATEFAKKLNEDQSPATKRVVQNDLYQAQLDEALNKFQLALTYPTSGAAANDIVERGKAIDEARALFVALANRDATHPLCWVAQAWVGECETEKSSPVEAQKRFDAVKKEALRVPAVAGAGARTARFFELRNEFQKAYADKNAAGLRRSQTAIESWLAEASPRSARANAEVSAARFYLANAKMRQAEPFMKTDPKTAQVTLQGDARALLQSAERDLRRLLDPENDYTARAIVARATLIRTLIGDPDKLEAAKLADYETCLMVAQVQYYRAVKEAETEEARKLAANKAVATYEKLQRLAVPREFARDALEAQANLAYAYTLADKPYQAAVLAESIARSNRNPAIASRAGLIAIAAYRQAGAKADDSDAKGRRADFDRAIAVGLWLDRQFPLEANTDSARVQVGRDMLQTRRYPEGFKLLTRVGNGSPVVLDARYLESIAAIEMLRAAPAADGVPGVTPADKAEVYQKALADLQGLPETPVTAPRGDSRLAVLLVLQLAELHFLNGVAELPKAEATAALAGKRLATYVSLTPDDKKELELRVELARMRALWGQAVILFQAKKYAEAVAKIAPVLKEAKDNGAVFKEGMEPEVAAFAKRVDEYRRDKLLGLAMQARIREGAVGQVGELLDVLKKLGGSLANSGGTLAVLIDGVRPQIDALRKEGKVAEADALMAGIGTILDKVAAEPDVKPPTIIVLAQGLNSIGNYDKAVEFLKKIEAPADAALMKKRPNEIAAEADQLAVLRYRNAQLEMARAYRLGKKYPEADAIMKEAVGDGKPGSGWANNADFKREVANLLEAKATDDPDPKSAVKLWGEARGKWTEMANQYFGPLKNLSGGKNDPRLAVRALLDLNALPKSDKLPPKPADIRAALSANPPPKWLTDLTVERVKGPDGKPVERPEAIAYVEEMRNTSKRLETTLKPLYHDLVFESIRCGVHANVSLLKANPAGLPAKLEAFAKQLVQLETGNPDMADEVKAKFAGLLDETPPLKEAYQKLNGKAFLKDAP